MSKTAEALGTWLWQFLLLKPLFGYTMVKSWVFGNLSCAQYITHVRRTDSVSAYCHAGREKNKPVDHMRQIPFIHTVPFTSYVKNNCYLNIDYGKVSFPWWRLGVFLLCSFDSYKLPWYKISNLHWKLFRIVLWKSGFFFVRQFFLWMIIARKKHWVPRGRRMEVVWEKEVWRHFALWLKVGRN